MSKELSYADVSGHNSKHDLYVVISDKIYNASTFIDEHPGGEEVLLDVAGGDATEAFEDVGHSDEAREILAGLLVGNLKRGPNDPKPANVHAKKDFRTGKAGGGMGVGLYAVIAMGILLAYAAYYVMQNPDSKK